jgi:hypothetical protein
LALAPHSPAAAAPLLAPRDPPAGLDGVRPTRQEGDRFGVGQDADQHRRRGGVVVPGQDDQVGAFVDLPVGGVEALLERLPRIGIELAPAHADVMPFRKPGDRLGDHSEAEEADAVRQLRREPALDSGEPLDEFREPAGPGGHSACLGSCVDVRPPDAGADFEQGRHRPSMYAAAS